MAYMLRNGVFQVKCRQPGCPFKTEFKIRQNIAGDTDRDCEAEALKIAQNMAVIKHDAIYGRVHSLMDPVVRKVGGVYVPYGSDRGLAHPAEAFAFDPSLPRPPGAVAVRKYPKGEVILRKGERASTVCEVLSGSAYPDHTNTVRYVPGRSFGAAGLLANQARTGSVLAEVDDTVIAFYNIQELTKSNPAKARELYSEIMEDTLHVITFLDGRVYELETEIEQVKAEARARARATPAAKKAKPAAKKAKPGKAKAKPAKRAARARPKARSKSRPASRR